MEKFTISCRFYHTLIASQLGSKKTNPKPLSTSGDSYGDLPKDPSDFPTTGVQDVEKNLQLV